MNEKSESTTTTENPLFPQLVMMLSSSALQHMGRAPGPGGEAPSVDLRSAEYMIDLLEMLESKTAGNLAAPEKSVLTEALAAVRMTFVQAAEQGGAPASPEEEPLATEGQTTEAPPPADTSEDTPPPSASPDEGSEPRFHKSYG